MTNEELDMIGLNSLKASQITIDVQKLSEELRNLIEPANNRWEIVKRKSLERSIFIILD